MSLNGSRSGMDLVQLSFIYFITNEKITHCCVTVAWLGRWDSNPRPIGYTFSLNYFKGWTISSSSVKPLRCEALRSGSQNYSLRIVSEPFPVLSGTWLLIALEGFPAIHLVFTLQFLAEAATGRRVFLRDNWHRLECTF